MGGGRGAQCRCVDGGAGILKGDRTKSAGGGCGGDGETTRHGLWGSGAWVGVLAEVLIPQRNKNKAIMVSVPPP